MLYWLAMATTKSLACRGVEGLYWRPGCCLNTPLPFLGHARVSEPTSRALAMPVRPAQRFWPHMLQTGCWFQIPDAGVMESRSAYQRTTSCTIPQTGALPSGLGLTDAIECSSSNRPQQSLPPDTLLRSTWAAKRKTVQVNTPWWMRGRALCLLMLASSPTWPPCWPCSPFCPSSCDRCCWPRTLAWDVLQTAPVVQDSTVWA